MNDASIDPAMRLVDAYAGGTLDLGSFETKLAELAARDAHAVARIAQILEQRRQDGTLPPAAFSALQARVDSYGATQYSSVKAGRGGTGTRLRNPTSASARTRTETATQPPLVSIEATLKPGLIVKKRFLLEQKIGEGGMGLVFKARDIRNERYQEFVAVKFLSDLLQDVPDALEALQFEVRKAHELAHPNIVTVYEFDQDGPLSFIYMELLEGEGLDSFLKKDTRGLPFPEAWPIVQGAGTALAYAHEKGIIHSDFKPGNVFITRDGGVKILDFGIARAARLDPAEFDTSVLGGLTPAYASPEMALGLTPDLRDDVYGLACVAYELLAGRHPFDRKPATLAQEQKLAPRAIPGVSRRRMQALERGLAFARDDRTPSVVEFLAELEQKPRPRHWLRTSVAALGVLAAATAGFYWYASSQQCATADKDFLDGLRAAASTERPVDPSLFDTLREQGEDHLADADANFDPASLSEGISNDAFSAFTLLLRVDRNSPVAEAGIMRVVDAYRRQADRLLDAGDARGAATVADYGLKVHPKHCALNSLKARALALLE